MTTPTSRSLVLALCRRISRDRLTLHDHSGHQRRSHEFGTATAAHDTSLQGVVTIHDARAYKAIVGEGSIGLGRGYIEGWWTSPDPLAVVQVLIRNMQTIDAARNKLRRATGPVSDLARKALPRDTRRRNREDIAAHYDIGNEFFELFLDETMTYSSAIFSSPKAPLAEASLHKYDLLLDKLGVTADHRLLEIGTGWGGMALRAAGQRECLVTTTTISEAQLGEARRRIGVAALDSRVELLSSDWRDLAARYHETFDRVVSVEMIEAVDWRDYGRYFATIERCMRPDGLAAVQAICVPDNRFERTKNTEDFIKRFVFPNGFLPSVGAIAEAVSSRTRMQIISVEDYAVHYAETLRRWRDTFEQRSAEVGALGLDERFRRLWQFYLAYCEAGFRERHCTVVQIVLAGREWRDSLPDQGSPP